MDEERIALFLDYENLAIGTREQLGGLTFDFRPVADALADRGRVVVRRAYADWTQFESDGRMLTRQHIELIEIPQRMGAVRKNAADIKMAVDAVEVAFVRDYVTTFVVGTGDSDFTPLVHKLRELNKRVIGVGVEASTSDLLPPACDEFLFYERLEGVERPARASRAARRSGASRSSDRTGGKKKSEGEPAHEDADVAPLVTRTVAGLQRSAGAVRASMVKRAILRKDPTFNEADYGFRAFGELLRHLEERGVVAVGPADGTGDPEVTFPTDAAGEEEAFSLLRDVVAASRSGPPLLSGLKNKLRKRQSGFTEKALGYDSFLQFVRAARTKGVVDLEWDDEAEDYLVRVPDPEPEPEPAS